MALSNLTDKRFTGASPEHALIHKAREGDGRALDALLEQNRPHLVAYCRRLVCPPESDAQDAVQDALARAAARLDTFRGDAPFSTWLHRIAINTCHDLLKGRKQRGDLARPLPDGAEESTAEEPVCPTPGPEQRVQDKLLLDALRRRLDERSWQILVFSKDLGMTSPEIARMLGISEGRVRQILGQVQKECDALWREWNAAG